MPWKDRGSISRQFLRERDPGKYPGGPPREIAEGRPISTGAGAASKKGRRYLYEGVYPPRVFDQKDVDLLLGDPLRAHDRDRVAKDVIISPAAVLPPLVLVPDILGDEDLLDITGLDDLDDLINPLVVRGEIDVPLFERVIPLAAEEVVLEDEPFLQKLESVFRPANGPVDMIHGGSGQISAGLFEDFQTPKGGLLSLTGVNVQIGAGDLLGFHGGA